MKVHPRVMGRADGGIKGFRGNCTRKHKQIWEFHQLHFPVSCEDRFHVGSPHGYIKTIEVDRIFKNPRAGVDPEQYSSTGFNIV